MIQTTSAVVDLFSGELVEASTYYPNGGRESYRGEDDGAVGAEPAGFTGKEADEEVGVTYFGERYLVPRLGRWASPDPLAVHAAGGGESLNAYHYVSGNLLQARDPRGLAAGQTPENVPEVNTAPEGVDPGDYFANKAGAGSSKEFDSWEDFKAWAGDATIYRFNPDAPQSLGEAEAKSYADQMKQIAREHGPPGLEVGDGTPGIGTQPTNNPLAPENATDTGEHDAVSGGVRGLQGPSGRNNGPIRGDGGGASSPDQLSDTWLDSANAATQPLGRGASQGSFLSALLMLVASVVSGAKQTKQLALGLDVTAGGMGYKQWARQRGFSTYDELSPRMPSDVSRVNWAMREADEIHFNTENFSVPRPARTRLDRYNNPRGSMTDYEFGDTMRKYQDKTWYWRGDALDYNANLQPSAY